MYYYGSMTTTVQARLDEETQAALDQLVRATGWTASEAIRQCILDTAQRRAAKPRPRLIGIGSVDNGPGDLATNKEHFKSFGMKSMGTGWRPPEDRGQ
jgi:predicted transcriptional regulator